MYYFVEVISSIHGILTRRSDGNEWRVETARAGIEDWTGRWGHVLFAAPGGKRFSLRDGTVKYNG